MAVYDMREGAVSAVSTFTRLITVGPETRNSITVPDGCHSIKEIWGWHHSIGVNARGYIMAFRLTGLKYGNYDGGLGGYTGGTLVGNAGEAKYMKSLVIKTNLAVDPGAEIWVYGCEASGASTCSPEAGIGLVFSTEQGEKRYGFFRWVAPTINTKTLAINDGDTATARGIKIPSDAKRITSIIPQLGGISIATVSGATANIRLEGGLPDGDFGFTAGADTVLASTAAVCAGYFRTSQTLTDVKVSSGATLNVYSEVIGTVWTNAYVGVAIEMAVS
jgi:hypothetical protein